MSRLGTETAFDVLARADVLARGGQDIINLGVQDFCARLTEHQDCEKTSLPFRLGQSQYDRQKPWLPDASQDPVLPIRATVEYPEKGCSHGDRHEVL